MSPGVTLLFYFVVVATSNNPQPQRHAGDVTYNEPPGNARA